MLMRIVFALLAFFATSSAFAQQSRVPPVDTFKMMLGASAEQGWIAFRNYDGKQYVYFTQMVTMRCGLDEIRYSINSRALDQTFDLVECIPANPFALPSDAPIDATLITLPLGTAKTVAVQAVFKDGTESEIMVYEPCEGVGDGTCAFPVE
jgi:hypothetical protein